MSELTDRELSSALRAVGANQRSDPAVRSRSRLEVLREFDRAVLAAQSEVEPVVGLKFESELPAGPRRGSWSTLAAAAVAAVVVLGFVLLGTLRVGAPVADQPPPTPASTVVPVTIAVPTRAEAGDIALVAIGGPVPAGSYSTAIAGGLRFEVPAGLTLVEASDDRLTFALDDGALVSLVSIEDVESLNRAIVSAEALGFLRVESSGGGTNERPLERRDLTLTAEAIDRYVCVVGEACNVRPSIEPGLAPFALLPGAENFTTLLEFGVDTEPTVHVAVVEQFAEFGSPTSRAAMLLLSSLEAQQEN